MQTHFFNLVVYAIVLSALLSIFSRDGVQPRVRFAMVLSASMVAGAVAVGWLMRLLG